MGKEREMIIGWKDIARFLGVSESTVKRAFRKAGIKLPKIGRKGRTSPVYLIRGNILSVTLKLGFQACVRGSRAV